MTPAERVAAAWRGMEERERERLRGRYQTAAFADAADALAALAPGDDEELKRYVTPDPETRTR